MHTLNLSDDQLLRPEALIRLFKKIPESETIILIQRSNLHLVRDWPSILGHLKPNIHKIIFEASLLHISCEDLGSLCFSFPTVRSPNARKKLPTVTTLDLSGNNLGRFRSGQLSTVLQQVESPSLTLAYNNLDALGDTLGSAFIYLHPNVKTLNLSNNGLENKGVAYLHNLISMIPATVNSICLDGRRRLSREQLMAEYSPASPSVSIESILQAESDTMLPNASQSSFTIVIHAFDPALPANASAAQTHPSHSSDPLTTSPRRVAVESPGSANNREEANGTMGASDASSPITELDSEQRATNNPAQTTQSINYSFYLKCIAGVACVGGGGLLISAIILSQPLLVYAGAGLLVTSAVSMTFSDHRFFKPASIPATIYPSAPVIDV